MLNLTFEDEDNYIVKVDPLFSPSLSTFTVPPIFSIIFLHILNPRPVPDLFTPLVSFNLQKLWKSFPMFSWEIPAPVSFINILKVKK